MGFGVFIHRADSIYEDRPAEQYQFPSQYFSRVGACLGNWIVYYEPVKAAASRGYFAVAKVDRVIPDPAKPGMHIALIRPGSYLEFPRPVPFRDKEGLVERGLYNDRGGIAGRAQAAVRPLSVADFNRIIDRGLGMVEAELPRVGDAGLASLHEDHAGWDAPGLIDRARMLTERTVRDRAFRSLVLDAYQGRCAISGLRFINGGGRAEAEAAHIRSVEAGGPDALPNGLALSGTVHWMFDRGLISLADDLTVLISRQVNDRDSVAALINPSGRALVPAGLKARPHPAYLSWHRENCFKH